jgi:hypothetical protein
LIALERDGHPVKKRSHLFTLALLGFLAIASIAAYGIHAAVYHHVMEQSEASRLTVQEMPGSNPLNLKITVQNTDDAENIRSVTTKRQGATVTILYHLSRAGLTQPGASWQEPYLLAVPDSVNEVRFGRNSSVIWQRTKRE